MGSMRMYKENKKVFKKFLKYEFLNIEREFTIKSPLYMGDIYNTIRIDLYENIKKIKWLIYEVPIEINNKVYPEYFFKILEDVFPLEDINNNIIWDLLGNKEMYENYWDLFKNAIKLNTEYKEYSNKNITTFFKQLIFFFYKNY